MRRAERRGIGRTEIIIGVAVVAVLVLIAVPLGLNMGKKSKRSEVRLNVDSIRLLEMTHKDAFDEYVSADPAPRGPTEVDPNAVPWVPTEGFVKLSWQPEQAEVRGSYSVSANRKGFTVTGTCDIDGDGRRAVFTATESQGATLTTEESVY
jgi:type II secretory pathway pseudopilin PulG